MHHWVQIVRDSDSDCPALGQRHNIGPSGAHCGARPSMKRKRSPEPKLDGRKARSQRSREAVVQAVLAFVREGKPRPSATQIARRAKVSRRVVFNQFKDMERLRAICL